MPLYNNGKKVQAELASTADDLLDTKNETDSYALFESSSLPSYTEVNSNWSKLMTQQYMQNTYYFKK